MPRSKSTRLSSSEDEFWVEMPGRALALQSSPTGSSIFYPRAVINGLTRCLVVSGTDGQPADTLEAARCDRAARWDEADQTVGRG